MKTEYLLLAETGGNPTMELDQIAERYLGITPSAAKRKARYRELPFPAFRSGNKNAPWLVHVSDLAKWLDSLHAEAKQAWEDKTG